MQLFGLADCNNFYCSCERVFHPDLIGKPVVVLSNNDGCVIARSEESKALGIQMGEVFYQIKDKLEQNEVAVFSSNYTAICRDVSCPCFPNTHRKSMSTPSTRLFWI